MTQQRPNIQIPEWLVSFFKNIRLIALAIIIIILAFSSVFQIEAEEVGIITRFGKFDRIVEPGLNIKIPFAENIDKVPVERQQKLEFGFRTVEAGVNTKYSRGGGTVEEALMLTGDLNLADVEWVVQYRIDNPYNYLFKVRTPESTMRDISESAMRQIVGDRTVNEVLTIGRAEIGGALKVLMQQVCNEYSLGVKIEQVVLQDVNPPEEVKPAFNEVNEAQQQKETLINNAKSEYNKVIPKAKGQAEETIQKAQGYATERVNRAKGEIARFDDLYLQYIKYPEVTRKRIYLETMAAVVPKMGNMIITDENGGNVLPLLNMKLNDQNGTR